MTILYFHLHFGIIAFTTSLLFHTTVLLQGQFFNRCIYISRSLYCQEKLRGLRVLSV